MSKVADLSVFDKDFITKGKSESAIAKIRKSAGIIHSGSVGRIQNTYEFYILTFILHHGVKQKPCV